MYGLKYPVVGFENHGQKMVLTQTTPNHLAKSLLWSQKVEIVLVTKYWEIGTEE